MKFKSLLESIQKENNSISAVSNEKKQALLSKLRGILKSNIYINKKPHLYRGRSWDGFLKQKDSESKGRRPPVDTNPHYDFLIHDFTDGCFSDFPDRWHSRFATTHAPNTQKYGRSQYIIFPHKNCKLAYSKKDPYDILVGKANVKKGFDNLTAFYSRFEKTALYEKHQNKISKKAQNVIRILNKIYHSNYMEYLSDIGCPSELFDHMNEQRSNFEVIELDKAFSGILWILKAVVMEYFDSYTLGYPTSQSAGKGEVIYQGKYLQVSVELYNEYLKKYD